MTDSARVRPVLSGEQRYRQLRTKVRIIAARNVRQFMAGEIDILPCSGDLERKFIISEFDRLIDRLANPGPGSGEGRDSLSPERGT